MDTKQAYRATQLLEGELKDRKEQLKKNIVKGALPECSDNFNTNDVKQIIDKEFDIKVSQHIITDSLSDLEGEYVERISQDKYKLIKEPEFKDIETLLEPCWNEYKKFLHQCYDDIDPQITAELKPLFNSFFEEFFLEISDSIEEINEHQATNVYSKYDNTEEIIDSVIDEDITDKGELFQESIIEYIKDPGDELLKFTNKFYTATLNVDLLKKDEEIIDFPTLPDNNKKLILDTNVIVLLLAESDDKHMLAKSMVEHSQNHDDMDFEICYFSRTGQEVDSLIEGTEYEINNVVSMDPDDDDELNQLSQHFRRKTKTSKAEYMDYLRGWREYLEDEYDIKRFEMDYKNPNKDIKQAAKDRFISESTSQLDRNLLDRIDHDSTLLGVAARFRDEADLDFGPFVISDHNLCTNIGVRLAEDEETQDIIGSEPIAFHPQGWLNYILAFTPVDLGDEAKKNISMGILSSSLSIEDDISIDEYIHKFTPEVGLEFEYEEYLKDYLLSHSLGGELERAIENNEIAKAREISTTVLEDDEYRETIEEERELHEKLDHARKQIEKRDEEIEELRNSPDKEMLKDKYRSILYQIDRSYPIQLEEAVINSPPEESSIEEMKTWLSTSTAAIDMTDTEDLPDDIKAISSDMEELYSNCIEFLS